jgi:ribosomal protein L7/L12
MTEHTDEFRDLISDGLNFLESMNRVYGADRAHELWLGMKDAMGRDVQMEIFNAMLKGDTGNTIRFRVLPSMAHMAVNTIKAIREYTGCGLKEAKDLWDQARDTGQWTQIKYDAYYNKSETPTQFKNRIKRSLREFGHEVS